MAQQLIGLGAAAGDGTGDALRVAGGKINANFNDLFARPVAYNRPVRAGAWYPIQTGPVSGGTPLGADTMGLCPFIVQDATRIGALLTRITSTSTNGAIRLILYASGSDGFPTGAPLCFTPDLSAAVSTVVYADVTPVTLAPGIYWFACHFSDGSTAVQSGCQPEAVWAVGHDDPMLTFTANSWLSYGKRVSGAAFADGPPVISSGAISNYGGPGIHRLPTACFKVIA